jgi:hypothetical protein
VRGRHLLRVASEATPETRYPSRIAAAKKKNLKKKRKKKLQVELLVKGSWPELGVGADNGGRFYTPSAPSLVHCIG